jgi:uncharacterized RDD family membrane protein YckC
MINPIDRDDLGGFWIRLAAYAIDQVILFFPCYLLAFSCRVIWGSHYSAPYLVISTAFSFFYFGLLQPYLEGSIGKKVLGLALVTESGETMTLKDAVIRHFMFFASGLLFLGFIAIGLTKYRQGWHDKVAKTLVVRKRFLDAYRRGAAQAQIAPSTAA